MASLTLKTTVQETFLQILAICIPYWYENSLNVL